MGAGPARRRTLTNRLGKGPAAVDSGLSTTTERVMRQRAQPKTSTARTGGAVAKIGLVGTKAQGLAIGLDGMTITPAETSGEPWANDPVNGLCPPNNGIYLVFADWGASDSSAPSDSTLRVQMGGPPWRSDTGPNANQSHPGRRRGSCTWAGLLGPAAGLAGTAIEEDIATGGTPVEWTVYLLCHRLA